MIQDELDELFGEDVEDSSMEISNLIPENIESDQEKDDEALNESQDSQNRLEAQETRLISEINLPTIQKLSNQGLIVIYHMLISKINFILLFINF